jgi:hypothetical protein
MKTVKIAAASLLMFAALSASVTTFAGEKGGKGKKHHCTEACKKEGKCVKVCGEKGHKCTDACKKDSGKKM